MFDLLERLFLEEYSEEVKDIESALQVLNAAAIQKVVEILKTIKGEVEIKLVRPNEMNLEKSILEKLEANYPQLAILYRQVLLDLGREDQITYRGSVGLLRELLREFLERIAPDEEVMASPGYEPEKNESKKPQSSPTRTQRVDFYLKKCKSSSRPETLKTLRQIEVSYPTALYAIGSKSTHTTTEKEEAYKVKILTDVVIHDLLVAGE